MIAILIPLANGMTVPQATVDSILLQTVCCKIVEHSSPLISTGERLLDKRLNECHNRNMLLPSASEPYALFLNHDVVLGPTDVADCCEFLDAHPEWDAVALNTKSVSIEAQEIDKHVCCACLMICTERWRNYHWAATLDKCSCRDVNEKFHIRYLDSRRLREVPR